MFPSSPDNQRRNDIGLFAVVGLLEHMNIAKGAWALVVCWLMAGLEGLAASAGANPATGIPESFFGMTNLCAFHLTIAADQWAIMEEFDEFKANAIRPPGNGDGPGRFRPGAGPMMGLEFKKGTAALEFEGRPFGEIRVRFKGNSSFRFARNSLKRSLKLDFNDLEQGRTFFGLTKLNLNNNAMDPSQLREALAYHVFRNGGVPAGRTAFARVFITVPVQRNKEYAGLYTAVEQVDERFLKVRFGTREGMLLKPEHLPGLPFFGNDWTAYSNQVQAKTSVTARDANRFIDLARLLNLAGEARFQAAVGDYVDIDEFLRFLALQSLLSNMDSPLMTGHNYYLYLHPTTRKFIWIPWDLNEAFGGFNPGGSLGEQMDLSVDQPFTRVNRLAERLLQAPAIKARYHQIVRGLLATNFSAACLFPVVDAMAAAIRPALANDRMVSLAGFEAALTETTPQETLAGDSGRRVDFRGGGPGEPRRPRVALKAFIHQRAESARLQLEGTRNGYVPREIRPRPNGGPGPAGPPMGPGW